jgi:cytochrome c-type biogenesis protein CcmH
MNIFWMVVAGLVAVIAIALLFVWLPWMRRVQKESLNDPKGLMAILTGSQAPAVIGGIAILLFAASMYFALTKPGTHTTSVMSQNAEMAPEHIEMINSLAARLEKEPNDGKGWAMLARAYAVLGRYNEALPAYEKAANLIPNDPVLLVDYADVLAVVNGKNLQGKPLELIRSALLIDPNNIKGLNLSGTAAFQAGDYTHAIGYWEKLLKLLPPDSPNAKLVSTSIAHAQAREEGKQPPEKVTQGGVAHISGLVELSPALAKNVTPNDTLFVFAKALNGSPMPIAVIHTRADKLPQSFTLDDSMAMVPTIKLSNFQEVTIGAKVSKTGSAMSKSGDLRGEVSPVKIGTNNVHLVIDKIVP